MPPLEKKCASALAASLNSSQCNHTIIRRVFPPHGRRQTEVPLPESTTTDVSQCVQCITMRFVSTSRFKSIQHTCSNSIPDASGEGSMDVYTYIWSTPHSFTPTHPRHEEYIQCAGERFVNISSWRKGLRLAREWSAYEVLTRNEPDRHLFSHPLVTPLPPPPVP